MAYKKLWEEKSDWGTFLEDLKDKSTWSEEYQKTFATCLNGYKPRIPNTLHQIDREAVAVEKEIVQRAPEGVVILVVDKHHEILLSAFPEEWGLDFCYVQRIRQETQRCLPAILNHSTTTATRYRKASVARGVVEIAATVLWESRMSSKWVVSHGDLDCAGSRCYFVVIGL